MVSLNMSANTTFSVSLTLRSERKTYLRHVTSTCLECHASVFRRVFCLAQLGHSLQHFIQQEKLFIKHCGSGTLTAMPAAAWIF